jgi:hypothetical protein
MYSITLIRQPTKNKTDEMIYSFCPDNKQLLEGFIKNGNLPFNVLDAIFKSELGFNSSTCSGKVNIND